MKLRYIKAKNILSFGEEENSLQFGPFNTIVGPNDSGKTNVFRSIDIMKKALGFRQLELDEVCNNGHTEKCLRLEIGLELDAIERDLLSKLITCGETVRLAESNSSERDGTGQSILIKYGSKILFKSLKNLTFILVNDDVRPSEPRVIIQLSSDPDLFLDRNYQMFETEHPINTGRLLYLGDVIIDSFNSHFVSPSKEKAISILEDEKNLKEVPLLGNLLKDKTSGKNPLGVFNLHGGELSSYQNVLQGNPILRELSLLFDSKELNKERLYIWEVLQSLFAYSFIDIKELRSLDTFKTGGEKEFETIQGSNIAKDLFRLTSSGTRKNREKFNKIHEAFRNLTDVDFDIVLHEKKVDVVSTGPAGIILPTSLGYTEQFVELTGSKQKSKQTINEAFIQVVKGNYPVPIERSASGLYEILLLLTKVIGETEKVILLDEPELHLHPSMQKRILNLLIRYGKAEKNQILLITHSPYFVSTAVIDKTWRFSVSDKGTRVHNIGKVLEGIEPSERDNFKLKLSTDARAILFSNGVILAEGLSDRIAIEQVDRHLSMKGLGANIEENEWPILDMGGKKGLFAFLKLCQILGVNNLAILDYDALMHKEASMNFNDKKISTSIIFCALDRIGKLENPTSKAMLLSQESENDWYDNMQLSSLKKIAAESGVFVFSSDLEGVMQVPSTNKDKKPLKALERVLEMVDKDEIPPEFHNMTSFLKNGVEKLFTP